MTSAQQRAELQRKIWQIANEVRGSVDGWDFKQFVLGSLFYTDDHIAQIMKVFDNKTDVDYFAKSVDYDAVAQNDYNLSVSSYVEAKDTREIVDITELNSEIKTTVAKIDRLRVDIDTIIAEIEGDEQ